MSSLLADFIFLDRQLYAGCAVSLVTKVPKRLMHKDRVFKIQPDYWPVSNKCGIEQLYHEISPGW